MGLKESSQVKAGNTNLSTVEVKYRVSGHVRRGGDVTVSVNGDKNRGSVQELLGQSNGVVCVIRLGPPRLTPEFSLRNFLEEAEFGEIDQNVKLLNGGGSPIGETRPNWETSRRIERRSGGKENRKVDSTDANSGSERPGRTGIWRDLRWSMTVLA